MSKDEMGLRQFAKAIRGGKVQEQFITHWGGNALRQSADQWLRGKTTNIIFLSGFVLVAFGMGLIGSLCRSHSYLPLIPGGAAGIVFGMVWSAYRPDGVKMEDAKDQLSRQLQHLVPLAELFNYTPREVLNRPWDYLVTTAGNKLNCLTRSVRTQWQNAQAEGILASQELSDDLARFFDVLEIVALTGLIPDKDVAMKQYLAIEPAKERADDDVGVRGK